MKQSDIRLLFVSDAVASRNGVGTYYDDLIEHLKPLLGEVGIIAPVAQKVTPPPHQLFSIPLAGDPTQSLVFPNPFVVWKMMKSFKPDVVILATPGAYGLLGTYYGKWLKSKMCFAVHTDYTAVAALYGLRFMKFLADLAVYPFRKLFLDKTQEIAVASALLGEMMQDRYNRSSIDVETPLAKLFLSPVVKRDLHKIRQVAFVGRFVAEKNIEAILEAAEQHPDIDFVLAGDGGMAGQLHEFAQTHPNLKLIGWVNRDNVKQLLDESDALVLPSHVESFGTVGLEAMSRGRMTIVSEACGIAKLIRDGENGFVIEQGSTFSQKLTAINALSIEQKERVVENARNTAASLTQKSLDAWMEVIHRLADVEGDQPENDGLMVEVDTSKASAA